MLCGDPRGILYMALLYLNVDFRPKVNRLPEKAVQTVEKVRYPDSMKKSLPSLKHPALDSFEFILNVLESPTELVLRSDFF
ncbi:MAG: hypothetical protein JWM44_4055, partial [Bacilli bacterium]|nr:hypothetical protein [Bacilli bacterium]